MIYIGMDVHKDSCYMSAIDAEGKTIAEEEIKIEDINNWITTLDKECKIAMESSTASKPLYHLIKEQGLNVLMAHPSGLRVIAESSQKTDRTDSFHLANLLRINYLPCSYVPDEKFELMRNICRYRVALGQKTTRIKNEVRALLTRNNIRMKQSDIFGTGGLEELKSLQLNKVNTLLLKSYLDELIYLMDKAKYVQDIMAEQAKDIPEVKLLMTIPGIDFYSAMTIIGEIGDITRFPNPKKLVSYAGLAPRLKESGTLSLQGRISKKGSRTLRWILISAADSAIRCKRGNNKLREFYNHLKKRGKSKQVAAVAVAKKLLTIIYAMLTNGTKYECEDKFLTMRKLGRMKARATPVQIISYVSEIDDLKEKINLIGGI
jgi:transposase